MGKEKYIDANRDGYHCDVCGVAVPLGEKCYAYHNTRQIVCKKCGDSVKKSTSHLKGLFWNVLRPNYIDAFLGAFCGRCHVNYTYIQEFGTIGMGKEFHLHGKFGWICTPCANFIIKGERENNLKNPILTGVTAEKLIKLGFYPETETNILLEKLGIKKNVD